MIVTLVFGYTVYYDNDIVIVSPKSELVYDLLSPEDKNLIITITENTGVLQSDLRTVEHDDLAMNLRALSRLHVDGVPGTPRTRFAAGSVKLTTKPARSQSTIDKVHH